MPLRTAEKKCQVCGILTHRYKYCPECAIAVNKSNVYRLNEALKHKKNDGIKESEFAWDNPNDLMC